MNLSGSPLDYFFAFFGGVLISFTPCVYPLIPVSVAFIGIRAGGSKLKGLILSLVYVTGIAITYTVFGLLASSSGKIFGAVTTNPIIHLVAGIIVIIFGISMFDVFKISLPPVIKPPTFKKQSYFSCFLLGLTSGLIISPCVTPVLGAILIHLVIKKNLWYGITLLLSFAYGMGLILIIAGTFSAILVSLPTSGRWMVYIKRACAFILLGMGIYFIVVCIRML